MVKHSPVSFFPPALVFAILLISINVVQGKFRGLFVFGDSFYDTGDSNYVTTATMQANIVPYGESFFTKPTGRFCDGRIIPDFIESVLSYRGAAEYANLSLPEPYLQPKTMTYKDGVDFACAGAGALNETFQGRVISLATQIENYKQVIVKLRQQFGYGYSKEILAKAVYLFNIGTNDYLSPLATNPAALTPQYISLVVGNITMAVEEIYRLGGRKFAINNVGPLGCFPVVKAAANYNGTCVAQVSQIVSLHNTILSQELARLATEYKDFKYGVFDMYTNLEKRISSPTSYGFKESMIACCGSGPFRGIFSCGGQGNYTTYELCPNPKDHLFWDSIHPSEMTYNQLATLLWSGSASDIGPYNVKSLFGLTE